VGGKVRYSEGKFPGFPPYKYHPANNAKLVECGMGMGFAPTWLRQVKPPPPASHDHFNHCLGVHEIQN